MENNSSCENKENDFFFFYEPKTIIYTAKVLERTSKFYVSKVQNSSKKFEDIPCFFVAEHQNLNVKDYNERRVRKLGVREDVCVQFYDSFVPD